MQTELKLPEDPAVRRDINILFVCMGNICRSPMAHGVFQSLVEKHSLQETIGVDSAGTYAYHAGEPPDPRARAVAAQRGYSLEHLRARKVRAPDFTAFDLILAMDRQNHEDLLARCPEPRKDQVRLLLDFARRTGHEEVPDPYYGGLDGFEAVLDLIEDACSGLLEYVQTRHTPETPA